MVVTERQFNAIDLLIGEEKTCDLPQNSKQLMEFWKKRYRLLIRNLYRFCLFSKHIYWIFNKYAAKTSVPILSIIPLRENTGNYNRCWRNHHRECNYTTTRKYRELQRRNRTANRQKDYTTTRKYRELQLHMAKIKTLKDYTTTRKYRVVLEYK